MKVTISQAAKLAEISRQHLYTKYIKTHILDVDREQPNKPMIDISELKRVFGATEGLDTFMSTQTQGITAIDSERVKALDTELQALRQQLAASQERERWLMSQVEKLTEAISKCSHQERKE